MSDDPTDSPLSDPDLLGVARSVLAQNGYVIEEIESGVTVLLAENAHFLIGVIATSTISELLSVESIAERTILSRAAEIDMGPKIWDLYLVLITQERATESEDTTRELYEINYDTSRIRRIAQSGVPAIPEAVREVLATFVAPITLNDPSLSDDPLSLMAATLASRGVSEDVALRAVDAFAKGVPLETVL